MPIGSLRRGAFIVALTLLPHVAPAATNSWNGLSGIDHNWNTGTNWTGGVSPVAKADLVFPPVAATSSNNDISSLQINSLTLSGSNYALTGNALTLGSAAVGSGNVIVNQGAANNSVAFNIALTAGAGSQQFFTVNSGGVLTLSGQLSGATGSELVKSGVGTLILTGDNSGFTGPFSINNNGGIVRIQHASALGGANAIFTVRVNSQLQLDNVPITAIAKNLVLNGAGVSSDGALLNLGGTHTLSGNIELDSEVTIGATVGAMTLNGVISDSGAGHSLTVVGGGMVELSGPNTFRAGTTIGGGVLSIANDNALGSVPILPATNVTFLGNGTLRANAPVNLVATRNITIANGVSGGFDTNGNAMTIAGAVTDAGTLVKSGAGTLEVDSAPTFAAGSSLQASAGKLRLSVTSGSPTIASGVTATVASGATLELAGSVSALGTAAGNRAHIVNNSFGAAGQPAGLVITGMNQVVGGIDGSGSTQANAGSNLTADHITQSALVIGGTAGNPALVTIDASNANGLPLADGQLLAGVLESNGPFASDTDSTSLIAPGANTTSSIVDPAITQVGSTTVGEQTTVPEPASILLLILCGLATLPLARQRIRRLYGLLVWPTTSRD
jgi:fibronectin-binding autotransporter adhesin